MLHTVHPFMLWNLYLAAIPAVLALLLFPKRTHVGPGWWLGFGAWLLFLPNAPYLLTDVVHINFDLHASSSNQHTYAVLLTYGALCVAGLASYVVSLQLFRRFLHRMIPSRAVLPVLLIVHGLCVVAMYVGRVVRINSWDVLVAPRTVLDSVLRVPRPSTFVLLGLMFVIVGVGAYVMAAAGDKAVAQLRRLTTRHE